MTELEKLAARVEALTGACRETDVAIARALGRFVGIRKYTASLDAAMTLAFDKRIAQFGGSLAMLRQAMGMLEKADATADALSRYVTAASLRALAAQEKEYKNV